MARLFYLSTLALTAALAAAAPTSPTEPDATTVAFKTVLVSANVREGVCTLLVGREKEGRTPVPLCCSTHPSTDPTQPKHIHTRPKQLRGANKAGRLLPALFPKNTNSTAPPPQPSQPPQQPAVDPLGPTTPTDKPTPDSKPTPPLPDGPNGDGGDVPHVPVPVSVTSTTTVTMDDGSTLTVKCTDDVCTACATDAKGQDLGCQPIECDEDGECAVVEPEVEVEAPEVKPEPKPKKRTEEKEDPSAAEEGDGK